jgi:hypothetical protein
MVGGFAAPSFLFLAGLSQVLADAALERRGLSGAERRRVALRRAAWLLGAAYAFRALEYVLGARFLVAGGWEDLLRVDVLNVIAVTSLATALLGAGASPRVHLAVSCAVSAAIALATPAVAAWSHSPSRALDYLWATFPRANFSVFNASAFLLAGSAAGRLVRDRDRPGLLLAAGAALFAAGALGARLPPFYAHQDFWHTSPAWFAMRLGVVVALTGALQRIPAAADAGAAWLRTLGRRSLLGYVASVELTYGYATWPLHHGLSLGATAAGVLAMVAATWGLARAADRLRARRPGRSAAAAPGLAA